jgi:hypothetical protein
LQLTFLMASHPAVLSSGISSIRTHLVVFFLSFLSSLAAGPLISFFFFSGLRSGSSSSSDPLKSSSQE